MNNKKTIKLWILIILLVLSVIYIHTKSISSEDLPEKIYIKTPTQTFTVDYYFALHNGKIYYKRNQDIPNQEMIYNKLQNHDPKNFNPDLYRQLTIKRDDLLKSMVTGMRNRRSVTPVQGVWTCPNWGNMKGCGATVVNSDTCPHCGYVNKAYHTSPNRDRIEGVTFR